MKNFALFFFFCFTAYIGQGQENFNLDELPRLLVTELNKGNTNTYLVFLEFFHEGNWIDISLNYSILVGNLSTSAHKIATYI